MNVPSTGLTDALWGCCACMVVLGTRLLRKKRSLGGARARTTGEADGVVCNAFANNTRIGKERDAQGCR